MGLIFRSDEYPAGTTFAGTDCTLISDDEVRGRGRVGECCVVGQVEITSG